MGFVISHKPFDLESLVYKSHGRSALCVLSALWFREQTEHKRHWNHHFFYWFSSRIRVPVILTYQVTGRWLQNSCFTHVHEVCPYSWLRYRKTRYGAEVNNVQPNVPVVWSHWSSLHSAELPCKGSWVRLPPGSIFFVFVHVYFCAHSCI